MARIKIIRKKTMIGMFAKITCYINGQCTCLLKNGENYSTTIENGIIEFRGKSNVNPKDENSVLVDLTSVDTLTITVGFGLNGLLISVSDNSVLIESSNKSAFGNEVLVASNNEVVPFSPTKQIGDVFLVDEKAHLWGVRKSLFRPIERHQIYSYDDILDYELIEDEKSIIKGGNGKALIGGMLFGAPGAVVGGVTAKKKIEQRCTKLQVKITIKDMTNPVQYIDLLSGSVRKNNFWYDTAYKNAQEIISMLQIMCNQSNVEACTRDADSFSIVEELHKLKKLMDDGVITLEEFEILKSQLIKK